MAYQAWLSALQQQLNELILRPNPLLGCKRRNHLSESAPQWRNVRADTLLAKVASKRVFPGPHGTPPWEAYTRFPYIITFRGGSWKEWWDKDLQTLAALAKSAGLEGVVVIHEVAGNIQFVYIQCPANYQSLILEAATDWLHANRINRSSQQGYAWCPHCPVLTKCMELDVSNGQTADWPNPQR